MDATHAKLFAALLRQLKRKHKPQPPEPLEPVTQLVISFLEWNATRRQAADAYNRIMAQMVDSNDLRVSHSHELVALLGADYPQAEHRCTRLREALQDIYIREHAVSLASLTERPKKEVRAYLDSLGGAPQYVAAQVTLLCFGGHAVPVDDKMAGLLVEEGIIPAGAPLLDIAAFLERQVKASDAVQTHQLMRAWADSKRRKDLVGTARQPRTPRAKTATATRKKVVRKKK